MINRNLKSALVYAQNYNFAVFPVHSIRNNGCSCGNINCPSPAKHPRIFNGVKGATKETSQIIEWWNKWPDANIGIACGEISNITVLDIDIKPLSDGRITLTELEFLNGKLPLTPIQNTGSGGCHIFFDYEPSLKNIVAFLPGLDIRNNGGYIVAAPSIHNSGSSYSWMKSHHIKDIQISKMPIWLLEKADLNNREAKSSAIKNNDKWINILKGITEGGRNNAATSLAGYLFYKKIDLSILVWIMEQWNKNNSPPLDGKELENIILSIGKKSGFKYE